MIKCICIDDSERPGDFPASKWVIKEQEYHITWVVKVLPQNQLAFSLYEKPLDESCLPYLYFLSTRFAINPEDIDTIREMFLLENSVSDIELKELFENSNIEI